jgi:S-adenosyl-L-methionine hydrolase (adenosine-forming)
LRKLPVITLTTDFGNSDGYAGSVKGIILGINPAASIIDISNEVRPGDIFQASFLINSVSNSFPPGTIHLVVVDPGVGSRRKAIILKTPGYYFVAPDNGLLTYVIGQSLSAPISVPGKDYSLHKVNVPDGLKVYEINNPEYWRKEVSSTFHGRDVFGPVAAHISRGVPLSELGREIGSMVAFKKPLADRGGHGGLVGEIIYVDTFGNLITNIGRQELPEGSFSVKIAGKAITGLSDHYSQKSGLAALIGSSGNLEIALRNGSAAAYLKVGFGAKVLVQGA